MKLYSILEQVPSGETFVREQLHTTLEAAQEFVSSQVQCYWDNSEDGELRHIASGEASDMQHEGAKTWFQSLTYTNGDGTLAMWTITENDV